MVLVKLYKFGKEHLGGGNRPASQPNYKKDLSQTIREG